MALAAPGPDVRRPYIIRVPSNDSMPDLPTGNPWADDSDYEGYDEDKDPGAQVFCKMCKKIFFKTDKHTHEEEPTAREADAKKEGGVEDKCDK